MGTRQKKRNILCALLMAGAAVLMSGFVPAAEAVQGPDTGPQMYQDAETEPVVLAPVDKTKGVTYVLSESGTVLAVNLNGNSVVIEAAEKEGDTKKYSKIYIDKNGNGKVDAGETAVKLLDSESGEMTEYINAGTAVYGVYEAKATEEILITYRSEGGGMLAGAYKGEAGKITIANEGSLGAIYGSFESCAGDITVTNSGTVSVIYAANSSERAGAISITNTGTASGAIYGAEACGDIGMVTLDNSGTVSGAIYGANNSAVTGDITITNTKAEASIGSIYGVCKSTGDTGSVKGNITIVNQGNGGGYCYGSAGAPVTGDISITNTDTSFGDTRGMTGNIVTGNIDVQVNKHTGTRMNGSVYGITNGAVNGKVTVSADDAYIGNFYGVAGGSVESAAGVVPLTVKLTNTSVQGYFQAVTSALVSAADAGASAVDIDISGSPLSLTTFWAVGAGSSTAKIIGNVDVDVEYSELADSAAGQYYLLSGNVSVDGNVKAALKNIHAYQFYGVYGDYSKGAEIAGSVDIDMQGCQGSSGTSYGCYYSMIGKNFTITGDAATYMRYFQTAYGATVKGDVLVTLYGWDEATSKNTDAARIYGINSKYSGEEYSVGGDIVLRLLGGRFENICAADYSSVTSGNVTVDMQGIRLYSNYNNTSNVVNNASVVGNVSVTTDTACSIENSLYCVYSSSVTGDVTLDIVSTSAADASSSRSSYLYGVNSSTVGGNTDIHFKGGTWYYVYGVNGGSSGALKLVIEDMAVTGYSFYGTYGGQYAGAMDVDIKNIKGSSSGSVYGVYGAQGEQTLTLAMSNIKGVNYSYALCGGSYKDKVTATVSDVEANYAYVVSNDFTAEKDADITVTGMKAGRFYGADGVRQAKTLTLKLDDCTTTDYTGLGNCTAEQVDVQVVNCTFKNLGNLICNIKADSKLSFTGGTYESYGSFLSLTGANGAKMQCTMEQAALTAPATSTSWGLTNYVTGDAVLEMTVADSCTCTLPAGYKVIANNSSGGAPASVYMQGGYYFSGAYPLTAEMLSGAEKLGLNRFQGTLPSLSVNAIDITSSSIVIPKGVVVEASDGFAMGGELSRQNIILLEGTLTGPYVAKTCNYTYFYMLSGGVISNTAFNGLAVKYYPVTLNYNTDEITIASTNLGSMALRPELMFAQANSTSSITCEPKTGFSMGDGTYRHEGDALASQMNKTEANGTVTYKFDMKDKPVTVEIACAGNELSVGKTVADPVAVLNHEYTSEAPLYDFGTLMIYNDGTEGDLSYALAENQTLPEGLSLEEGKLVGTPTVVNTEGAKVTFVVTGRNGTTADVILNIIVSTDENTAQTNQDGRILIDEDAKTINCLGSSVLITACDEGTAIYLDEDRDGEADYAEPAVKGDFSAYTLYGLKDFDSQRPLSILMKGGTLTRIYGVYNCDVTAEPEGNSVYVFIENGSVKGDVYGAYTAEIAGGIHVGRSKTGSVAGALKACDDASTYKYTWLDYAGQVAVAGDYTFTEDTQVSRFTIVAGTYKKNHNVTVNQGVTLTVTEMIIQNAYTNFYNKGTVSTDQYLNNYSTSAHFVTEGAKLLPETNTFNYIYYPMTVSCEDLPKTGEEPVFSSAKTYEDVVYGSPSADTYIKYQRVAGYTAYYRVNNGQETELGTTSDTVMYSLSVRSERKPTNVHVFYVPNEIAARIKFSVPAAAVGTEYSAESPLYDCAASIELQNDADAEHGGEMLYQVKKGSSLPAGLRLEDGKLVGTPTEATNGAVPVTLLVTGRNGMVTEVSLEVSVTGTAELVPDINDMISLSGSTLDLKGTSVVIYADASSSSYCNIYLDENHDGIADNDKAFKVNDSAKLSLSNKTIYGWKDTSTAYEGDITIYAYGGTIGSVYGVYGSSGKIAEVNGKVSLYMKGSNVDICTAAGYYASAKELNLYCTAGTLNRNVYSAYEPASVETVRFTFTENARFSSSSNSSQYMAVTMGGTVTGNVYAQVGGTGNSFISTYNRFYGVNNTKVSGNVNYSIKGDWKPYYENHFARNAVITGDMNVDWQDGCVTTNNSSASYRVFAYNSVIDNLTVNVAADAVMSSSSAMYPFYIGTIQNVYMYVPDALSKAITTALVHPNSTAFPVENGYVYNRGAVWISGEHKQTENMNVSSIYIYEKGRLMIPEDVIVTAASNINCYGTIENAGTLTTESWLYVYAGGVMINKDTWISKDVVYCYGAIENKGTWNSKANVMLYANAAIDNNGQWNTERQVSLAQSGATVTNKSLWDLSETGSVILNVATVRVVNEGEWTTDGQVQLKYADNVVENSGTWNMNRGVWIEKGKLENSGTFNGKYYSGYNTGSVYAYNGGTVVNTGNWLGNAYIYLNGGTMDNAGTLEINPISETNPRATSLLINNASSGLINREDGVVKLAARISNNYNGKIVNYGTMKQTYKDTGYESLGNVYAAKPVTLPTDIAQYSGTSFYYPATVNYPEAAVTGATLATVYSSGVAGDENQYLKAKEKFTVTLDGYAGDYTKADVQSVVYGSEETEATVTSTENQWQGTMPQESITVQVNIVKNDASQIEIAPGEVTVEKLTVNQRNNSIYDLRNLEITNDDGTEGEVSYAVSSAKPLPEGLTLNNGVISGTPRYASSEPYTAEIIVTGKNLTTAILTLTFTQIEKAVPSLTVPTGLYGNTNYKLSQVHGMPKPSTGVFSWPDADLVITEKCVAGEKFDLYFTPADTDNYDWSKVNISAGTWNEEEKRVECKVNIRMYTIPLNVTPPEDITAVYGQTLADVKLPSDENGVFVWKTPTTSVGNVGSRKFYASYVPADTKRYSTVNCYITVTVKPKEVTAQIPEGLRTYTGNTIGQVELPQAEFGAYKWLTAASTVVEENTSYKAVFVPDDNTNYKWTVGDGLTYSEAYKGYVFDVKIEVVYHEEGVHTFETKYDGTYHWKECICGEIADKEKHTLGDLVNSGDTHIASCTFEGCKHQVESSHSYEKKVGETEHWYECACHDIINRAAHSYSRTVHDETNHWKECSCGARTEQAAHAYTLEKSDSSSHWKQCSCGDKTEIETHKFETLEHDGENHWYACACGAKNNIAPHTYGDWLSDDEEDNHYALCDCGAKITADHKYGECVSAGKDQHKEVCEDCGKEVLEDHTWDAGVVTVSPTELKTGLKVYTCIGCAETKEEVLPKNEPPHTNKKHLQAYDESEHWDVCDDGDGYEFVETRQAHTFTDWQTDDETGLHWKECTVCGYKKQLGAHTWKTVYDADSHWQECNVCGQKKAAASHTYVNRSDEVNHWKACSCGRRIDIEQHVYISYSYDAKGHWDECSCGKRANEAAHSYGKWQPTEDGKQHFHECICGYEETADHAADYVWKSDGTENHTGTCADCGGNALTELHTWDAGKVTVKPTESELGVRTYTCTKCKATKTETIDKLQTGHTHAFGDWKSDAAEHWKQCECGDEEDRAAHQWNKGTVTQEPTETETGVKAYRCTVCGKEKTEELPKLAHEHKYSEDYTHDETYHWKACGCGSVTAKAAHQWNKGTVLKPATIEETGIMQYQCTVCDAVKQTVLPKLTEAHEHTFGDWIASDDINHTRTCSCGNHETRAHSFGYWTKDDEKNHKKTCKVCGHALYEAHAWDAGKITTQATEEAPGVVTYTCKTCGETKEEYYSLGDHIHEYGDAQMKDADTHMKMCKDPTCGQMLVENHVWDAGKVTAEATETTAGTITYTCKECSYKKTETIAKHTHECDIWEAADDGVHHTGVCIYGDKEIEEEHTWNDGVITVPATETTAGAKLYTCTKCEATKTEVIPKHEHAYGAWVADGEKNHKKACECGETVTAPHDWDEGYITKPATKTEEGEITYTCETCGGTKVSPLAKIPENHTHKNVWVKKDADNHAEMCKICGEPTGNEKPHDWDAGEVTIQPTETAEGVRTYHCLTCNAKKTETIAKLEHVHAYGEWVKNDKDTHKKTCGCGEVVTEAHSWNAGEVTTAATAQTEGIKTYTCTVCGETKTEKIAKLEHVHAYGEWVKNDKDTHKKVCGCGEVVTEAHSWNAGEVTTAATTQAEGVKTYTCTVCGETKMEAVAKLPSEEPREVGAELTDEQGKAKFTVVDPASIDDEDDDEEDDDTSPAVIYTGSVDAEAEELTIPDTVTVDNVEYRVVSVADGVFKNNKKLKKITIGNCVRKIGDSAFEGCSSLKTVTFKKTSKVKTIGKKAFYKCTSLTKITVPKSVVTIKDSAFEGCKKLTTVTFQSGSKLKTIGKKAFSKCTALKKITIPKNVTSLGTSAFDGCKKLATVTFQSGSKLKKIGTKTFNGCVVLKKITIPKNVTEIGGSAFNKCKKLATITIQSTKLKKVGKNAFKGIKSTATIKVPSKKLTAYKKLLKNKGQGKKVKIKKI